MSFWDHVYASRVPMWVVQAVIYVVGLAILEAHTEAARAVSFALAIISAVFHLWYTAYVGYRLWNFVGHKARPKPNARDYHSILIWLDIFIALMLVWAHISQSIYVLWPDTFEVTHLPGNHWWAAFNWMWNAADTMTANSTPFEPKHTATRTLYAFIGIVQYFYLPVIVAIGLQKVWEHKELKEHDLEAGQSSAARDQQEYQSVPRSTFQRSSIASFGSAPPPSVYPSADPIASTGNGASNFASWYTNVRNTKPMALSAPAYQDVYAWTG